MKKIAITLAMAALLVSCKKETTCHICHEYRTDPFTGKQNTDGNMHNFCGTDKELKKEIANRAKFKIDFQCN